MRIHGRAPQLELLAQKTWRFALIFMSSDAQNSYSSVSQRCRWGCSSTRKIASQLLRNSTPSLRAFSFWELAIWVHSALRRASSAEKVDRGVFAGLVNARHEGVEDFQEGAYVFLYMGSKNLGQAPGFV
jgi:hypothetical protein